ncbi:MAG TPA: hypothetical protein VND64_14455 [Pirellulales bacterium]|nr:hypothetical protein [Pirellulales bacterium]
MIQPSNDASETTAVLRITQTTTNGEIRTVRLEGKLLAPWMNEVLAACGDFRSPLRVTRLDLSEVDFVDSDGVRFLHDLIREGVEIAACSAFVSELLHLKGP